MDERSVVTCFLRHEGRVLLFRRSPDAASYPGTWGTVTGYLTPERDAEPEDPETAARREIAEETGLGDAVTLVRQGERFAVVDADRGTRWLVHPFLFDSDSRAVETNDETSAYEWAHATEIRRRETVPDLWGSYDRVRPSVTSVRADTEHGSAWLSVRALETLRDEAALAGGDGSSGVDRIRSVAAALADARPSMAVLANRVARVMAGADTPAAVERAARATIDDAVAADAAAAETAAERVAGRRLCTLSRSGTVLGAVERADPEALLIAESRPGGEGVDVAEALAADLDVTLTSDAALASRIDAWDAEAVLIGADTVLPDGRVLNKVGSRAAALSAARAGIDCYAVASVDKITPERAVEGEQAPQPLYEGEAPLSVDNPLFETVPAGLLDGVCTERGVLDTDGVRAVAAEHRAARGWRR